jgi:hypothetical protein
MPLPNCLRLTHPGISEAFAPFFFLRQILLSGGSDKDHQRTIELCHTLLQNLLHCAINWLNCQKLGVKGSLSVINVSLTVI